VRIDYLLADKGYDKYAFQLIRSKMAAGREMLPDVPELRLDDAMARKLGLVLEVRELEARPRALPSQDQGQDRGESQETRGKRRPSGMRLGAETKQRVARRAPKPRLGWLIDTESEMEKFAAENPKVEHETQENYEQRMLEHLNRRQERAFTMASYWPLFQRSEEGRVLQQPGVDKAAVNAAFDRFLANQRDSDRERVRKMNMGSTEEENRRAWNAEFDREMLPRMQRNGESQQAIDLARRQFLTRKALERKQDDQRMAQRVEEIYRQQRLDRVLEAEPAAVVDAAEDMEARRARRGDQVDDAQGMLGAAPALGPAAVAAAREGAQQAAARPKLQPSADERAILAVEFEGFFGGMDQTSFSRWIDGPKGQTRLAQIRQQAALASTPGAQPPSERERAILAELFQDDFGIMATDGPDLFARWIDGPDGQGKLARIRQEARTSAPTHRPLAPAPQAPAPQAPAPRAPAPPPGSGSTNPQAPAPPGSSGVMSYIRNWLKPG
jgi:hypothetical protein